MIENLSRTSRRQVARDLERSNRQFGARLERWDPPGFEQLRGASDEVWRSKGLMALVYRDPAPGVVARLTVHRTTIDAAGRWVDGITWDELQAAKNEAGFAGLDAVEVYPADGDVVNVANMRHLWVLSEKLAFAWRVA